MEKPLLRDPAQFPSPEVLSGVLGPSYAAFTALSDAFAALGLEMQWNYYRDGGAWLCKVVHKKKTVCWLGVWEGRFAQTFYFTEKAVPGIMGLPIGEAIKHDFAIAKPIGKLIPLQLWMADETQLPDALRVVRYKKELK